MIRHLENLHVSALTMDWRQECGMCPMSSVATHKGINPCDLVQNEPQLVVYVCLCVTVFIFVFVLISILLLLLLLLLPAGMPTQYMGTV